MRRILFVLMILIVGLDAFAADGDLIVNGKVGIGTTSPATKLHVVGSDGSVIGLISGSTNALRLGARDTRAQVEAVDSTGVTAYQPLWLGGSIMQFSISNTEKMRLDANGNLGIATTDPKGKFSVGFNNDDEIVMYAISDDAMAIQTTLDGQPLSTYGGNANQLILQPLVGTVGIGVSAGNYKLAVLGNAYATGYWQSSDLQFKENIIPVDSPLAKILKFQGVTYNWKMLEFNDKGFPEGKQYGFVAQEVEKIIPELVKDNSNGEKAISYNGIIPVLVEAIKAQQRQIEILNSKIEALEAKN